MKFARRALEFLLYRVLPGKVRKQLRFLLLLLIHPAQAQYLPTLVSLHLAQSPDLNLRYPWLPLRAVSWLDHVVTRDMVVFEYGSGGSTIYLAHRAKQMYSVEHSQIWQQRLSSEATTLRLNNCKVELMETPPLRGPIPDPTDPKSYGKRGSKRSWKQYVTSIDRFPDASIDLVIVDGMARPSSIAHAIPKVKAGGVLLLDDADRLDYQRAIGLLETWHRVDLSGMRYDQAFITTIAWRKPETSDAEERQPEVAEARIKAA